MFEKKTTIFKKKDRETWELIKAALKEDKIRGVHAFHYFADVVAPGGCASKLDPRNFAGKGRIDHDIYEIEVRDSDIEAALRSIRVHGIVTTVDDDAALDAAVKFNSTKADRA